MMAATDGPDVNDREVVHITPAGDDEEVILPEGTDPASEGDEGEEVEDDTDTTKPDEIVKTKKPPAENAGADEGTGTVGSDGLKDVDGETPRERALRKELTDTRKQLRGERGQEVFGGQHPAPQPKRGELSDQDKSVLGKYKPEEIGALKEVLPVLAKEMGYVRADDLAGQSYADKAQETLDSFLEKHPEYLPENDTNGTLWNAFKAEYGLYKQPANPKDFSKIFDRIHRDVFGIKPAGPLAKVQAQQEKTKVASHAGASSTTAAPRERAGKPAAQGFRTDALKGFTDEEKAEMFGE